jgi:hypothetical protein
VINDLLPVVIYREVWVLVGIELDHDTMIMKTLFLAYKPPFLLRI